MNNLRVFSIGLILGAISWGICSIVSDSFEPFDTDKGLMLGQLLLSIYTVYIGYLLGLKRVFLSLLGIYIGQNVYAYTFGGSETKAWFLLGMFTTLFLCISPLFFGVLGATTKSIVIKLKKI